MTKEKYNILALHDAYIRSIKNNNRKWIDVHEHTIIDNLKLNLPHGSGIDADWQIDIESKYILCHCSYHKMDDGGYYRYWIDFTVKIKALYRNIFGKLDFTISGQFGKDQDIKEYLYEIVGYGLKNL